MIIIGVVTKYSASWQSVQEITSTKPVAAGAQVMHARTWTIYTGNSTVDMVDFTHKSSRWTSKCNYHVRTPKLCCILAIVKFEIKDTTLTMSLPTRLMMAYILMKKT